MKFLKSLSCFALICTNALSAFSTPELPIKGTIFINKNVTTHIIMPENIKMVDISTNNIVGNQAGNNIIRIKPFIQTDSTGTAQPLPYYHCQMLGTITLIGERHIAQYDVAYTTTPSQAATIYKIPYQKLDDYTNPDVSMPEKDMSAYCWAVYRSPRKFNNITSKRYGIKACVNNIYSVGNYFFIDYSLKNDTNIPYDIAEMRVFLQDKKEVKATNVQTIELQPVYSLNQVKAFKKSYRNVLVIDRLTFPEAKVLKLEISENQISGRVIELMIEYDDILNADGFDGDVISKLPKTYTSHITQ